MDAHLENNRIKENIEYIEEQDILEDENSRPEIISKLKLEHLAPYLPYRLKDKWHGELYPTPTIIGYSNGIV